MVLFLLLDVTKTVDRNLSAPDSIALTVLDDGLLSSAGQ